MKKLLKVLMVSTVLVFAGCEGDEGPQGPAGPAGADGVDGNANVKSVVIDVHPNDWVSVVVGQGVQYQAVKSTNLVSQDIMDSGSAHLYYETAQGTWLALPVSSMLYLLRLNEFQINTSNNFSSIQKFKLVTVAGELQTKVNFNDHDEVMETFNIVEEY